MGNKDFVLVTRQLFLLSVNNLDTLIYIFTCIPIEKRNGDNGD